MVVLEGGGMLATGSNQYLQPDYLSPLPTTLDAKKSPLALLAQTCSQIGADSPPAKPLIPPLEKAKKSASGGGERSAAANADSSPAPPDKTAPAVDKAPARSSPHEPRLAFKPYEANVLTKKTVAPAAPVDDRPPSSKSGSGADDAEKKPASRAPSRKSASPAAANAGAAPGPYVSYARVKTAAGGEALVPVCKDPYCTGCQYSAAHQHMLLGAAAAAAAAACPSGCTQCDHQKYAAAGLAGLPGLLPPGSAPPPLSYSHQLGRPYVCNWIAGESYCGKRFASSDELLQHLRTHTSLGAAADSAAAAAAAAAAAGGPMSSLLSPHSYLAGGLPRAGYPNPPLSPLSAAAAAARYHPYSKPGLPPSLAASPFSAFNPTALGPYYAPYSLYGQRVGAAAVHP